MERDEIKIGLKGNYAYLKNITVTGINDKHVIMSDVNGDTKEVFKSLFLKYFKEQHTQKKQHCTQCETLKVEVERLKEIIKETFVNNLHIFCPSCKEKDCLCMLDCTCEKLRNILDGKK